MEPTEITKNLIWLEEGIWVSRNRPVLSYPMDRHDDCFSIEEQSFWFRHRNNCLIEVLKRFPPGGTIYDVGGGNGYITLTMKENGFDAVLVEPRIQGARNAKSRGLHPIICATLEDAGFRNHSLPAIGLFDVLEHIEDDAGYLRQARTFLKNDGRLYLTVPAYQALWSTEDEASGHYRRYAGRALINMLVSSGYQIDYATHFFSFLPPLVFLRRTIPSKIGLRQRSTFKRNRREHAPSREFFNRMLDWYLREELLQIRRRRIRFGSSCLVVARSLS